MMMMKMLKKKLLNIIGTILRHSKVEFYFSYIWAVFNAFFILTNFTHVFIWQERISKPIPSSAASGLSSAIEEPYSYELDLMEMEKTLSRIPWIEFIGIQQYADEDEDEGSEELESAELPSPTVPIHESPSNTNFKTRQEVHLPSITELMKEGGTRKESHAKANVPHDSCDETLEKLLSTTVTVPLNTFDTAPAAKSAPGVSVSVFSDVKDDADNFLDDL
eukprot:TRINITY_DN5604_c0_g1_i4.p1 TRINITY_DN5604_c0_g1~~TRINITY_DN5604_c0_g1_i4.p1  ORF type:complete len:220 (+),score=50.46 TRINITY_DN5604_c0_g1_i4:382-1041(+)